MPKHDWNSLQNYLSVHEKTLRRYENAMETVRTYMLDKLTDQYWTLTCKPLFLLTYKGNRIRVDIEKDIEIDPTVPNRPRARTFSYSYSAIRPGSANLIRYCSPHDDGHLKGSAPHHEFHHRHDFTKDPKGQITILGSDDWPHVSEFLDEVLRTF